MFKLQEENKKANLDKALDMLKNFKAEIPSLVEFQSVTNTQEAPESNYDIALICDFNDINGLNEYQVHPVHKNFGAFINTVKTERACIDYSF